MSFFAVQSYLITENVCTQITEIVHTVKIVHRRNCTHPLSKLFTPHPQHDIWKMILKFFVALFFTIVKFVAAGIVLVYIVKQKTCV